MFIGHYAVALAAKPAARRAPLWTLVLAVQWPDLLWPFLLLTGVEQVRIDPGNTAFTPLDFVHYPVSHSLSLDLMWGVALGAFFLWRLRDGRAAVVLGASVVSHWVLDWISHGPDMPLWPGGPLVGLGLWRSVPATVTAEVVLFALGLFLYLRATEAKDRIGRWAFWALVGFLCLSYVGNLMGPPPPSVTAMAWVTLALWLVVPWAAAIDRHRLTSPDP
ncbi:MAG TPA: hypothetical protein VLA36_01545 [Longimicrobiales bacterium]|nr:hypothetical protein [Longimicrobiales bacterium]